VEEHKEHQKRFLGTPNKCGGGATHLGTLYKKGRGGRKVKRGVGGGGKVAKTRKSGVGRVTALAGAEGKKRKPVVRVGPD